ncbi:MAG TPA: hypothetical protein EYP14_06875, partial [Planctomycetaceae bacterium]|nr:hypothetical protein [Planctomycetaceae bacterium]
MSKKFSRRRWREGPRGTGGTKKNASARSSRVRPRSLAARYSARRRAVLRAARRDRPVDAFLATDGADIRYLCGATEGSESLLFGEDWSVVMTRRMYEDDLPEQCPGSEVILTDREGFSKPPQDDQEIAAQLRKHRARRLGFDETAVSLSRYRRLLAHVSEKRLVPFRGLVPAVRSVKDEEEITLTRKAVRIAESAFRELIGSGGESLLGQSERQLAAR